MTAGHAFARWAYAAARLTDAHHAGHDTAWLEADRDAAWAHYLHTVRFI